ncbi:hypothetical protein ACQ5SK_25985 [Bradyrhizobium japonicum]
MVEAGQEIVAAVALEHDHVRRRRRAVGFDRRRHATHLDLQMGLAETTVFAGRLHRGSGLDGLAESLDRHARRGSNMFLDRRRRLGLLFLSLASVADHLPVSLSLAFSASG